jgi:excisionase family DNA binding protein
MATEVPARRLWKASELQRMLGLGRRTTYDLIRRGAFGEPVMVGNSPRIPTEAVDEFIARRGRAPELRS